MLSQTFFTKDEKTDLAGLYTELTLISKLAVALNSLQRFQMSLLNHFFSFESASQRAVESGFLICFMLVLEWQNSLRIIGFQINQANTTLCSNAQQQHFILNQSKSHEGASLIRRWKRGEKYCKSLC